MEKIGVVTGGNRGIGLEVVRLLCQKGIRTLLTSRNQEAGMQAVSQLKAQGFPIEFFPLEVTSSNSRKELSSYLQEHF